MVRYFDRAAELCLVFIQPIDIAQAWIYSCRQLEEKPMKNTPLKYFKGILILFSIIILSGSYAFPQSSGFYAYYTRLDFDDNNNTGKYADIVVKVNDLGRLIFSREYSYLPYWEAKGSKHFLDRIIPFNGDGPDHRPDRINKCSYVRVVESSEDKITIHWRYAPDQNSLNFTDFKKSYNGDIGKYFADYVDEYFTIDKKGIVTRKIKKGCYSLDEWKDPMNVSTQVLELTGEGIETLNFIPAKLQNLPGEKISGSAVINKENQVAFSMVET